jgi:hypothetical protein
MDGQMHLVNPTGKKNAVCGDQSLMQWHDHVNCHIEAHGARRFEQDPEWV